MYVRRLINSAVCIGFLSIVLSQFQSCGPMNDPNFYSQENIDGEVRIIDRWADQQLEFAQALVMVSEESETSVKGLCIGAESGEPLQWEIIENAGQQTLIDKGVVDCERGEFSVDLFDVAQLKCDVEYQVFAQKANGGSAASTFLMRQCDSNSSI